MTDIDNSDSSAGPSLGKQAAELLASVQLLTESMARSNLSIARSNDAIASSNDRITDLVTYSERSRRLIRTVAVTVALDIALSLGLGTSLYFAHRASNDASAATSAIKSSQRASCIAGNGVRANDIELWAYVIAQIPKDTDAQRATAARLTAFVATTFAPRNCS